ncbi:Os07g0597832 [Oryza sativa Japonica Group]|uniref:Os07g0597832 protein n=1 Tax=Oryza sativa subsp. japonica TaxID=39947 RepID=A0A0N7KNT2_ORYSJ|nr:Os07g0597832 [Oryza sativa Japonica Group]
MGGGQARWRVRAAAERGLWAERWRAARRQAERRWTAAGERKASAAGCGQSGRRASIEVAEGGAWRWWASSAGLLRQPCRRWRRERRASLQASAPWK